jgi:hypothetical protein
MSVRVISDTTSLFPTGIPSSILTSLFPQITNSGPTPTPPPGFVDTQSKINKTEAEINKAFEDRNKSLSPLVIGGILIGILFLLSIIGTITVVLCIRKKQKARQRALQPRTSYDENRVWDNRKTTTEKAGMDSQVLVLDKRDGRVEILGQQVHEIETPYAVEIEDTARYELHSESRESQESRNKSQVVKDP